MDKHYHPQDFEEALYEAWERAKLFEAPARTDKPYAIMIPPPNVTGSLHMGHALNSTLQDVLIRYHRMRGYDCLWQPGSDHASIAVQTLVERQLAEKHQTAAELGRERFLEHCWAWRANSGGEIMKQLRRLGCACDWSRERFTLDEGLSQAVTHAFVELYRAGLIYKDKRLVNWDPSLRTAVSDLEVQTVSVEGTLWHIRYEFIRSDAAPDAMPASMPDFMTVATTRPETLFGDVAVAVHPEDERYAALVGHQVRVPVLESVVPIVADAFVDPKAGTGVVKITPAHDPHDFEVARRHDLPMPNIFTPSAALNASVPPAYRGLDRFEARTKIVADLEARGALAKAEPWTHGVPHSERGGVPVEPLLTIQWYVDTKKMAERALEVAAKGEVQFTPPQWKENWDRWLESIQPWCVSRQLWWGHPIPAWYGPDGAIFVAASHPEAQAQARVHYGLASTAACPELRPDPDVLDTWFSSGLWPFSSLGWPDTTQATYQSYFPTQVLVTGFDILFFWVARMVMLSLYFTGQVPFRHVYVHALVRDKHGQKMSKSKGNVINPVHLIESYGADAMRFALLSQATPGRDVRLHEHSVRGFRNFMTKLWNVARFLKLQGVSLNFEPPVSHLGSHLGSHSESACWLAWHLAALRVKLQRSFDAFRFDELAHQLYHFSWHVFCDWYLEFVKIDLKRARVPGELSGESSGKPHESADVETLQRELGGELGASFATLLCLLHPFIPFVTEKINQDLGGPNAPFLLKRRLPEAGTETATAAGTETGRGEEVSLQMPRRVQTVQEAHDLIRQIRSIRTLLSLPPQAPLTVRVEAPSALHAPYLEALASVSIVSMRSAEAETNPESQPRGVRLRLHTAQDAQSGACWLELDLDTKTQPILQNLERQARRFETQLAEVEAQLADQGFLEKAPPEHRLRTEERRQELRKQCQRHADLLSQLRA